MNDDNPSAPDAIPPAYGSSLFPQHAQLLADSAVTPDVAHARGYRSVDTKAVLESIKIAKKRRSTPGLLIPVHGVSGNVAFHQYRPDRPVVDAKGESRKYETPFRARMVVDVPPHARDRIDDPTVPLWITEGARKADAAVSAGLCCVALLGVWNWRGTNELGGKTYLACWDSIALNGRQVYIAFDSDVMTKDSVRQAIDGLARFLQSRDANVQVVYLPHGDDGAKVGLDDYLAAGHTIDDLLVLARDPGPVDQSNRQSDPTPTTPAAARAHLHTPPKLASDQHILDKYLRALRVCKVVGEEHNAKLAYLALTSRLLPTPVSLAIKGLSSSGKSYTIEQAIRFFPESAYILMTGMSERALIYMQEDFAHRTIVLFEATALREEREKNDSNMTAYFVRSLLSEGVISYPVTVRDKDGGFVTKTVVKEGPTNLIVTTTAVSLHGENETRMLSLPTDDSPEQTQAVLAQIAADDNGETVDFTRWHQLQEWLQVAEHRVVIPYAPYLAQVIPAVAVRLRRDFKQLLALIRTHAILHQLNRARDDDGRIIANETDYAVVRELVSDLISAGVGATVAKTVRETVETIRGLHATTAPAGAKVADIAAKLEIDRSSAQRRCATALEHGYIVNQEEKRGRPARYVSDRPLPGDVELLPENLDEWEGVHAHPDPRAHHPGDVKPLVRAGAA